MCLFLHRGSIALLPRATCNDFELKGCQRENRREEENGRQKERSQMAKQKSFQVQSGN